MSKHAGTDQGRHIQALRDRARRPDIKDRSGRGNGLRDLIDAELAELEDDDE